MEDSSGRKERSLKRCYQCSRMQEQLWDQAYEQIWPLVRKRLIEQRNELQEQTHRSTVRVGA